MCHPSLPPALALLLGIAVGSVHHVDASVAAAVTCLGWTAAWLCLVQRDETAFATAAVGTFIACGMALGSSSAWEVTHTPLRAAMVEARGERAIRDEPADPVWLTGRLTEDATPSDGGVRVSLDATDVEIDRRRFLVAGGVLLTVAGQTEPAIVGSWRRGRALEMPVLLRRPARYLDPGVPDFEWVLARRGITLVGSVKSSLVVRVAALGDPLEEAAAELRARARRTLDRVVGRYSPRSGAIVRAVLLGDRAGLDAETEERLQQAGTYHVLAISGGNIAILAGLFFACLRLVTTARGATEACVAACLVAYAFLVGGGASVVRATLMAVTFLAAHAVDCRSRPLNTLGFAALVCLSADPLAVFDPGAWLTYGATLAILVGTPIVFGLTPLLPAVARAALAVFAASLSAEIALFPVGALVFSRVTAAGLVLNFAAVPLMGVVQVGGMVVLALSAWLPRAVDAAGLVTHHAAWGLVESARLVDLVPWVTTRLAPPGAAVVTLYYLAWAAWFAARSVRQHGTNVAARARRVQAASVLAMAGTAIWIVTAPVARLAGADRLRITFLDVGQGDATLVRFPSGQVLLVDAGGAAGGRFDIGRRVIEPALWASGARSLTHLVLSHGDLDHIGGAPSLVRDLSPTEVWEGVPVPPLEPLRVLRALVERSGGAWRTIQRHDRVRFGGVDVAVWHPPVGDWERQRVRNDDSVVVELRYGEVSVVLPGDIEAGGEAALAPLLPRAPLRIVQAPHHGSASSSSAGFLAAAAPALVVISAGRGNRFGHPHRAVLERYRRMGVGILRTDRDGAITVDTDGREVQVATFTGRRMTIRAGEKPAVPPA